MRKSGTFTGSLLRLAAATACLSAAGVYLAPVEPAPLCMTDKACATPNGIGHATETRGY